ncbi:MAG: hypothetical protein RL375_856 [Pseudomonadota bacterium]|jgi:hypothetical protein
MATKPAQRHPALPKAGDVDLQLLPPQLRLLVRAIGEEAAFKLAAARGGTVLHVPTKLNEDHPICDLIGGHAFGLLVRHHGGMKIELTKVDSLIRQVRHKRVAEMAAAGCTLNEIALSTNYSRRHVINVLAELRTEQPEQLDMFAEPRPAKAAGGDATDAAAHNPFHLAPQ